MNLYYLGAVSVVAFFLFLFLHGNLREHLLENIRVEMRQNVRFLNHHLNTCVLPGIGGLNAFRPELSREFAKIKKKLLPYRITLIIPDGTVVADSDSLDPARFENHKYRIEIVDAVKSGFGSSIRYSQTFRRNMLYLAWFNGRYTLRIARLLTDVDDELEGAGRLLLMTGFILLVVVLGINLIISWLVTRPIREMREFAGSYRAGNLSFRMPVHRMDELGDLQSTLNTMAENIDHLVHVIHFEKQRVESVLATVTEGLVLINRHGELVLANRVFRGFFESAGEPVGLPYYSVIDSNELNERVERTLSGRRRVDVTVSLARIDEVVFDVTIIPVEEEGGVLLIMRDVTARHRFEKAKSDFVANASHELKTPLSIIGGYVETLRGEPEPEAEVRRNFLDRILSNVERLGSIIGDITSLNKLEEGGRHYRREPIDLGVLIGAVVESLRPEAERRSVSIHADTGGCDCRMKGVPQLLESIFYNLIDNGIKYNRKGRAVSIFFARHSASLQVVVSDDGLGFSAEAAQRLFERFFRVDSGRSRKMGGTGLGLAIVKHAVQLHGGSVRAESDGPGRGARFVVDFPV